MKAPSLYVQIIATSWGWQPHQIWSYGPLKSTIFHGFGSRGWICAGISPEPYKLRTWDLHHWIQQRLTFGRMCKSIVITPSDLELWTREISYVSWIGLGWLICAPYLLNPTSYGHETCTVGYSKDWGLKGFVEILWQPHQVWSYEPLNSTMFHSLVHLCKIVRGFRCWHLEITPCTMELCACKKKDSCILCTNSCMY